MKISDGSKDFLKKGSYYALRAENMRNNRMWSFDNRRSIFDKG
jgi:hypothetical protein